MKSNSRMFFSAFISSIISADIDNKTSNINLTNLKSYLVNELSFFEQMSSQQPTVMCNTTNQTLVVSHTQMTHVLLCAFFMIIEVIGIVGNSLVIIVVLMDKKMRKSPTNLFITNLAVADLLILIIG